jgi:mannose-6-phosphate isomerase-like protein (cupin superfamily)
MARNARASLVLREESASDGISPARQVNLGCGRWVAANSHIASMGRWDRLRTKRDEHESGVKIPAREGDDQMHVQLAFGAKITEEYGGDFRRLFPWPETVETPWGSAWMTIKPGTSSMPHSHDEQETFIILNGEGQMKVNEEARDVGKGDVIYLPPFSKHSLTNTSANEPLELLCIWWNADRT